MSGYQALREAAAFLDVSRRGRIAATGEDRARLFHAITTNHIQQMTPGEGCYAFFLNAQGRILADASILCFAEHLLIETEPELREKLYQHIDKYIIADDVTLVDRTEATACIAVEGPKSVEMLAAMGAPEPSADGSHCEWESATVLRRSLAGGIGFSLIVPAGEGSRWMDRAAAAGGVAATEDELRTVRIENGKPRYGEEITERYLVQETQQMQAVHFSKGCYLGQEIVERVRSRAQIHRMLMAIDIEGSMVPAAGTKLDFGEIVSAAYSPAMGHVVAMAYIRTERAKAGEKLSGDGLAATVAERRPR